MTSCTRRIPTGIGIWIVVATLAAPSGIRSQIATPRSLTLEEAVTRARENNPSYLAVRNDATVADWDVRSAYGSWAPSLSAGSSVTWQGPGEQRFGSLTAEELGFGDQPSYYFSTYNLGLSYTVDGATLLAPGRARALREATGARIRSSAANLEQAVTAAYLDVLRQEEGLRLARRQRERAEDNLRLATAQRGVGSVTDLDVRRAQVEVGRARVEVLRAENAEHTARVSLLRQLGIDPDPGEPVELTTTFELREPVWTEDDLYEAALRFNPMLAELEANRAAADVQVRAARSSYWPSLSLQAGFSGFAREASDPSSLIQQARLQSEARISQCAALNEIMVRLADPLPTQDCSVFALTEDQIADIRARNNAFPFDFTGQPPQASLALSIPIFQGLGRQREVEAARVERADARYRIREQELSLRADIASGLAAARTAYQSALIEQENQDVADDQLRLAREQYQVGQISFLELAEAETVKAQADREQLTSVYAYHDALANLEAIVGRPLRASSGNEE